MPGIRTRGPMVLAGVLVSLCSVAACRDAAEPIEPSTVTLDGGGDAAFHALHRPLAALRGATARYHRLEAAMVDGYDTPLTPCWYHSELGGMGYHYGNVALIDGTVELLHPEILIYEPQRSGRMRLGGMEYIVPIDAWTGDAPPRLLGREFHRNDALGLYALHIWLWNYNPSGLFEDWNSRVSCQYAEDSEDRAP